MKRNLFFLLLACLLSVAGYSQDTIVRSNGEKILCKITKEDSSAVYFKTKTNGRIINTFLKKDEIKSFEYDHSSAETRPDFGDRKMVVQLDLLLPTVGLETRVSNYNTLLISYHPALIFVKINNEPREVYVFHQLKLAYREFYNIEQRKYNKKRTDKFSGNFYSLSAIVGATAQLPNIFYTIGPTWGLQRNWGSGIHFLFEIGAGFTFPKTNPVGIGLIGDLKFGYAF